MKRKQLKQEEKVTNRPTKVAKQVPSSPSCFEDLFSVEIRTKWEDLLQNCFKKLAESAHEQRILTTESTAKTWIEKTENALYDHHKMDLNPVESVKAHIKMLVINITKNSSYLCHFTPNEIASMSSSELVANTELAKKHYIFKHHLIGWENSFADPLPSLPITSSWYGLDYTLILVSYMNPEMLTAFQESFQGIPRVEMIDTNIVSLDDTTGTTNLTQHHVDALGSPANCVGNMDGGIDRLYADHFEWSYGRPYQEPNPLQDMIDEIYGTRKPYLPIGDALVVPIVPISSLSEYCREKSRTVKYLIASPTMELPQAIAVGSRIVYQASLAMFRAWRRHNEDAMKNIEESESGSEKEIEKQNDAVIKCLAVPSFGTGIGDVPPMAAAKQMMEGFVDAWS